MLDPEREVDFPESVIGLFRGELGQPAGGFPEELQKKVLKGEQPLTERPGATLPPMDLDEARATVEKRIGRKVSETELSSYTLYPKVFEDYAKHRRQYGDVSVIPTPVFFYGMGEETEIDVAIERGKTLFIRHLATSEPDAQGERRVFFELNGQPRSVNVADRTAATSGKARPKAEEGNPDHLAAPMPGVVVSVSVQEGQAVEQGDPLLSIEAMKMETVLHAEHAGVIDKIVATVGAHVDSKDLLIVLQSAS